MKKNLLGAAIAASITAAAPSLAMASTNISAGVWASYRYVTDSDFEAPAFNSDLDEETGGDIGRESLILYGDHSQEDGPWRLSAEARFGPGSFSDPENNATETYTALHKLWVGRDIGENWDMKIGKSEVPFGWKTVNFWPGDMLQGGYGDQMDLGVKFTGDVSGWDLAAAYYHQDDWGETSTDTLDDNKHWGSSTTYRKIQTGVADASYTFGSDGASSAFGVSAQAGKLQDLSDHANDCASSCTDLDDGSHNAMAAYYQGEYGPFTAKAEAIQVNRDVPNVAEDIENTRYAVQGGYSFGNWFAFLDATAASTDTDGNSADTVYALSPGITYDYGPGWVYLEYLKSDGDIDQNGDIDEADFDAMYVTMDYYF